VIEISHIEAKPFSTLSMISICVPGVKKTRFFFGVWIFICCHQFKKNKITIVIL
jgi:hypothetical protein